MRPWLIGIATFVSLHIAASLVLDLRATCRDGWSSPSIGSPGACSHHGGVDRRGGLLTILFLLASVGIAFKLDNVIERRELEKDRQNAKLRRNSDTEIGSLTIQNVERGNKTGVGDPRSTKLLRPIIPAQPGKLACPQCGSAMRMKKARKGYYRGKFFWSCTRFPQCKGTAKAAHKK